MGTTKTFRQAAAAAYREAQAAARAADMVRARLDGEALTRVLREEWGLDVTVETSPAIVDGVLLRCISMAGQDPEISAALQCVMCGCPRWYQLHTGLADIGRILNQPGLLEYGHGRDPFDLAEWPRCVCEGYGDEPDTNELAADVAGVWITPRALWADGEEHACTGLEYWLPASVITRVVVERPTGAFIDTATGLAYDISLDDLPRILAVLGIPEPPALENGGAS